MARYDDLNTGAIAYATFVGSVLLLVIILLVRALCYGFVYGEDARKLEGASYIQADQEISEQKARINGYQRTTKPAADGDSAPPAEILSIPVEQAKEQLLKELSGNLDSSDV